MNTQQMQWFWEPKQTKPNQGIQATSTVTGMAEALAESLTEGVASSPLKADRHISLENTSLP